MVTTVKITEFKERNLSTDLICLAQLVQGGGCSHHSPLSRYIRLYQRYKIEGLHPNRGSNWLWIQISEQRKKSRLILQSGMYTFCVTSHCFESRARPFFFRVCIYRRLGQAKMLQNSVNKYKWKEGMGGGGGSSFCFTNYPNSNCDISGHVWDIAKYFSALNSLLSDLWEKNKKFGRFKNLKVT